MNLYKVQTLVSRESEDDIVVTASQVKNLVLKELQVRNKPEVASSLIGEPTNTKSLSKKSSIKEREHVQNNIATNKNRLRFDRSTER